MAGALRRPDLSTSAVKTILVPGGDGALRAFIAAEAPVPVNVVSNPEAPLGPSDLAVLVVDTVDPPLRAAATRVMTEEVPYVVLVRRDVWSAGSAAVHKLLDEVQRDPRHKLIRFWRDRDDLERTLREEVFALDSAELVGQTVTDGSFVKLGSARSRSRCGSSRTPGSASGKSACSRRTRTSTSRPDCTDAIDVPADRARRAGPTSQGQRSRRRTSRAAAGRSGRWSRPTGTCVSPGRPGCGARCSRFY